MATATLANTLPTFPVGTVVGAYPLSGERQNRVPDGGQAPQGSSTTTATVAADGSLAFTGLADGTTYAAGAQVNSVWVYRQFRSSGGETSHFELQANRGQRNGYPDNTHLWFNVMDYGAKGDGVTDDRAACLACHLDAETAGNAVVLYPGGTYLFDSVGPIPLNPARTGTGWLRLSGYGATIKIGPNMAAANRGFLTSGRTADDQTLARVIVEGFEIDGQKLTALASEGLRGGNIFRAAGSTLAQRLNYEDIIFRDIYSHGIAKPTTYGDGTGTFNNQTHLYMACYHADQTGAVNTIKRIRLENVRMESGVHGVFIGANVGSGTGATVYYDDIKIVDCLHDHLETHTNATGSNFQVGSHAYGDRCVIERCEGRYSNDTSFEVNACQQLAYRDCVTRDYRNAGFYARDFHAAQDTKAKVWVIENCKALVDNIIPDNANYPCHGIQIGAASTDVWGAVSIRNYLCEISTAMLYNGDAGSSTNTNNGHAIYLLGATVKSLRLEQVEVRETNIALNTTTKGGTFSPVQIRPQTDTDKMRLVVDGLHVKQAGAITAIPAAWTYFAMICNADPNGSGSDISVDIRNVDVAFGVPSNGSYAWGILALGAGSSGIVTTLRGAVRRLNTANVVATTGGTVGVRVGATDRCTIDKWLVVENSRFTSITNNADVQSSGTGSNLPSVKLIDCTPTVSSTAVASATTVTLPLSGSYFTITGTTAITSVTASWAGRMVTLNFGGALTFTDGSNLLLAGSLTTTADDTITLVCDGTNWIEVARSVN